MVHICSEIEMESKAYLDSLSMRLNSYIDKWVERKVPPSLIFKIRYAQNVWESFLIAQLNREYLTASKLNVILHGVLDEIEIVLRNSERKQKERRGKESTTLERKQASSKKLQNKITPGGARTRYNPFTKKEETIC